MANKRSITNITTEQWTLAYCMLNVLASVVHQTNVVTLSLLAVSAAWVLWGKGPSTVRSVLGIAIGLVASVVCLWRQSGTFAIGLAIGEAICAVALLQCYFSQFSLRESLIFLLRQSVRFETIYVILFGMTLAILPQLYRKSQASRDYDASITGLNTEVGPGGVAKLAQSNRVAFIVQFDDGDVIKEDELYWAAARLSVGDGLVWKQDRDLRRTPANDKPARGDFIHQEISLMSESSRVLPGLDPIAAAQPLTKGISIDKHLSGSYVAKGSSRHGALRYEVWSAMESEEQAEDLTPSEFQMFTTLASPVSGRVSDLARSLDLKPGDAMVAAHSIENYFRDNGFVYSLRLSKTVDSVGDFIFQSKKGFCEHYAASFAALMRTLHYPVRLVVGYQGGLRSHVTSKFIVRDQDAHVWTEVWSKKQRRWMRFDPTAAVAPDRIHLGSDSLEEFSSRPFYLQWMPLISMAYSEFSPDLLALADAYDNQWISSFLDHVVSFAADYLWWILLILGTFAAYLLMRIVVWSYRRLNPDPLTVLYRRFLRRLAKRGIASEPSDTALSLSIRASVMNPSVLRDDLILFAEEFNRLKYSGRNPQSHEIKNLQRLLKSIFQ